jgi:hypothetical protein
MKELLFLLFSMIAINANAEVINLVANSTPPANCKAGEPYDIYSYHEIHVINASHLPETLRYGYQICMDGICDNANNTITVYPQQHWDNSRVSHIRVRMSEGKHYYSVITECGKERVRNDYAVKVK